MVAAFCDGDRHALTLWTFPHDAAFPLRYGSGVICADVVASVQRGKIFTQHSDLSIQLGDVIIRPMPSGVEVC